MIDMYKKTLILRGGVNKHIKNKNMFIVTQ